MLSEIQLLHLVMGLDLTIIRPLESVIGLKISFFIYLLSVKRCVNEIHRTTQKRCVYEIAVSIAWLGVYGACFGVRLLFLLSFFPLLDGYPAVVNFHLRKQDCEKAFPSLQMDNSPPLFSSTQLLDWSPFS